MAMHLPLNTAPEAAKACTQDGLVKTNISAFGAVKLGFEIVL
jgi:hypothetical protein